jgi:hypothetical protein
MSGSARRLRRQIGDWLLTEQIRAIFEASEET